MRNRKRAGLRIDEGEREAVGGEDREPHPALVGDQHVGATAEWSAVLTDAHDGVAVDLLRPREPPVVEAGVAQELGRVFVEGPGGQMRGRDAGTVAGGGEVGNARALERSECEMRLRVPVRDQKLVLGCRGNGLGKLERLRERDLLHHNRTTRPLRDDRD